MRAHKRESNWRAQTVENDLTLFSPFQAQGEGKKRNVNVYPAARIPYSDDRWGNMQKTNPPSPPPQKKTTQGRKGAECVGHTFTSGKRHLCFRLTKSDRA